MWRRKGIVTRDFVVNCSAAKVSDEMRSVVEY
jgi:hypothetical protein